MAGMVGVDELWRYISVSCPYYGICVIWEVGIEVGIDRDGWMQGGLGLCVCRDVALLIVD